MSVRIHQLVNSLGPESSWESFPEMPITPEESRVLTLQKALLILPELKTLPKFTPKDETVPEDKLFVPSFHIGPIPPQVGQSTVKPATHFSSKRIDEEIAVLEDQFPPKVDASQSLTEDDAKSLASGSSELAALFNGGV
jgi:hypothetical protein